MATSRSDPAAPSPEELAAIAAAVTLAWPEPPPAAADPARRPAGWRFSGRWWSADERSHRRPTDRS
jgi:hypothetical protein